MSAAEAAAGAGESRTFTQKMLDGIEKAGNKVPHPVMMFIYLIALVMVLSVILDALNVSVTEEILVPAPEVVIPEFVGGSTEPAGIEVENFDTEFTLEEIEVPIRSLLTVDGLRFIFTSFVNNFANFSVVAVIFVAMIGVGVAERGRADGSVDPQARRGRSR